MQDVLGDATAADLAAAWRLAFAVCGKKSGADAAAEAAVAAQVSWLGPPSPIELLSATYREVEPFVSARGPGVEGAPAAGSDLLTERWWSLPADQRAALWLLVGDRLPTTVAAEILSLAPGAVQSLVDAAQEHLVTPPITEHCPSRAELAGYATQTLPGSEDAAAERHLTRCAACRERLSLVERLRDLGDPEAGPVPPATDAGQRALNECLQAIPEAWAGDLIDMVMSSQTQVKSSQLREAQLPVAPPSLSRLPDEPILRRAAPRWSVAPQTRRAFSGPLPAAPAARPEPRGSVATAALAAFRLALGDFEPEATDDGHLGVTATDRPEPTDRAEPTHRTEPNHRTEPTHRSQPNRQPGFTPQVRPTQGTEPTDGAGNAPVDKKAPRVFGRGRGPRTLWRARKDSTAAVAGPPPGSGDRQSVAPAMPPPPRPSVLAGRVGAVKNSPEAASAAGEVINEAGESRDDAWAPDESAWATYASSGDPPADEGPTAPVPVASLEVEPVMAAHPLAVPNAPSSGSAAHRQPPSTGQLASRVLAGAITGVLASGVVASIVLHPHGLAHFETVQVKAPTVTSLFPNQYTGASVAPDSPPLVIVPPGSLTTSRVPTAPVPSATTTAVPPNRRK